MLHQMGLPVAVGTATTEPGFAAAVLVPSCDPEMMQRGHCLHLAKAESEQRSLYLLPQTFVVAFAAAAASAAAVAEALTWAAQYAVACCPLIFQAVLRSRAADAVQAKGCHTHVATAAGLLLALTAQVWLFSPADNGKF